MNAIIKLKNDDHILELENVTNVQDRNTIIDLEHYFEGDFQVVSINKDEIEYTASPRVLEAMDAFLQYTEFERQWERSGVPDIFYRNTNGGTWEDVQKANPQEFLSAWYKTTSFIIDRNIDFQDIIDEQNL